MSGLNGYSSLTLWGQSAVAGSAGATAGYVLGTQFTVSWLCSLSAIWWYSPAAATVLPTTCGVWNIATQGSLVEDSVSAWKTSGGADAVAGGGWVRCDLSAAGLILPPGLNYAVAVFQPAAVAWYIAQSGYWNGGGAGAAGLTTGPLSAPPNSGSVNGQGCYDTSGAWAFPGTNPGNGESHYADVEILPVIAGGHLLRRRLRPW